MFVMQMAVQASKESTSAAMLHAAPSFTHSEALQVLSLLARAQALFRQGETPFDTPAAWGHCNKITLPSGAV